MPDDGTHAGSTPSHLSLAEQVVLGVVAEGSLHGFAVARLLEPAGEVGRVYTLARPAVYRAVDRLVEIGLLSAMDRQAGNRGPQRVPLRATAPGLTAVEEWLWQPVEHIREMRTEFLAKLALIGRSGRDPGPLVEAQARRVTSLVEALADRHRGAEGFDRVIALWRLRTGEAALEFLQDLMARPGNP